jgi:hypothetical protein
MIRRRSPCALEVNWTSADARNSFRKLASQLLCRTLMDVYGRPRMAPRAGFEILRKLLNAQNREVGGGAEYARPYPTFLAPGILDVRRTRRCVRRLAD